MYSASLSLIGNRFRFDHEVDDAQRFEGHHRQQGALLHHVVFQRNGSRVGDHAVDLVRPLLLPHQANIPQEKVGDKGNQNGNHSRQVVSTAEEKGDQEEQGAQHLKDGQGRHQTDVVLHHAVHHRQVVEDVQAEEDVNQHDRRFLWTKMIK
ncbi:hypothetical protein TYRP_019531 [Tyrophagus putrescentiae]|nr:hypothetical protein TYRP_019531 [Tyrophagus putrescentiae]